MYALVLLLHGRCIAEDLRKRSVEGEEVWMSGGRAAASTGV